MNLSQVSVANPEGTDVAARGDFEGVNIQRDSMAAQQSLKTTFIKDAGKI